MKKTQDYHDILLFELFANIKRLRFKILKH